MDILCSLRKLHSVAFGSRSSRPNNMTSSAKRNDGVVQLADFRNKLQSTGCHGDGTSGSVSVGVDNKGFAIDVVHNGGSSGCDVMAVSDEQFVAVRISRNCVNL